MEMWLKRLTLLLLTVAATVISSQDIVPLDEKEKEIALGSPLILNCNFNMSEYERFRMYWYFNPYGPSFNETHSVYNNTFNRSTKDAWQHTEGFYKRTSYATNNNDSGWYFCKVTAEIPIFMSNQSNGTKVTITKSVEHTTHPSLSIVTGYQATVSPTDSIPPVKGWLWILLGVFAIILIILLIICILLRRRCRRSRAEDPIYANTRPVAVKQPSPRPRGPADNLKTVPSTQNLRNPSPSRIYEDGKRRHKR